MPLTTLTPYKSPAFRYGWIPEAVSLIPGESCAPPAGIWVCNSNIMTNWSNAQTEAIGTTHHFVNPGTNSSHTPFSVRGMLDKGDGLWDMLGQGNWPNADKQTCINAANSLNPSGGKAAFYMTEYGEKLVEFGVNFFQWNASQQKAWIDQRMATLVHGAGGKYFADYDGHLDSSSAFFNNLGSVRSAFDSNAAAHSFALANSGFDNPYYKGSANQGAPGAVTGPHGAFRHGVLKFYMKGEDDVNKFVASNLCDMLIDRMARAHTGFTTEVACMFWPGFDERPGRQPDTPPGQRLYTGQIYNRVVPAGGTLRRSAPPYQCFSAQIFLQALAQCFRFHIMNWTESGFYGADPNISYPPDNMGGIAGVTATGNVGPTAKDVYVPGETPAGYPYSPKGSYDISWAGVHLGHYVHSHAGTSSWAFAPIRVGSGAVSATLPGYLVDQYQGQKVYGFIFASGNNRSYIGFDGNQSGTTRQITVTIPGGGDYTYNSSGMTYHAQNFTV